MTAAPAFNRAYFEQRINRNRTLAAQSDNPNIRGIHLDHIRFYEHLLVIHGGAQATS